MNGGGILYLQCFLLRTFTLPFFIFSHPLFVISLGPLSLTGLVMASPTLADISPYLPKLHDQIHEAAGGVLRLLGRAHRRLQ